ncbi:MAG: 2-amino-4-hydroxy-6-hydroxymethyldihydropteridine diphosphokinase [Kiritimatiellae bacterium]|nr:2-amino-4-hydroxy-6-hydroxymethyldihydropteridine diphosphokinase [Kiritimatiellia bacterium]
MARAVLALGSNLGDREGYLSFAVSSLSALPETRVLKESNRRETAPVDVPAAYEALRFLNAAVLLETTLSAEALLSEALAIEAKAGRIRTVRNGPRPLDIDLILYEGIASATPRLTLPHPRAHLRDFVLAPLRDLGFSIEHVLENRFP